MLPYEHSHHQNLFEQPFDLETSPVDSCPPVAMDGFNYQATAYNNTYSFAFADLPASHTDISAETFMLRTTSNSSMKQSSHDYPPALYSSASIGSATSSTVGSPYSGHAQMAPMHENYGFYPQTYMSGPTIVTCDDGTQFEYVSGQDVLLPEQDNKFIVPQSVDPNLLSSSRESIFAQYASSNGYSQAAYSGSGYSNSSAPSPVPSHHSYGNFSQTLNPENYTIQPRLQRDTSVVSNRSGGSPRTSVSGDEDSGEKGRCTYPDCGKIFKDLKAHMLTHQQERPEKCPIPTCTFHKKGFARKYDKNRHTLTHYKGTMVCGFCPGSGSPAEKSFNRADVFKRHLTSVHNVEQNPPNSRKRSPSNSNKKLSSYCHDATGKCSTCSGSFNNAQEFYDHLDDCVLRIVQQVEESEDINVQRLAEVDQDLAVQEIFDRHHIKQEDVPHPYDVIDDDDEDEEDNDEDELEEDDDEDENEHHGRSILKSQKSGSRAVLGGNISKTKSGKKGPGMTWSKVGRSLVGKGRKRRKHYPPSWGMSADKMNMKKRVLCVYDGPHRLLKDDMMLNNEFEVRVKLADGNNYVTDLDIETLKRAKGYHEATEEEKGGPWIPEQDFDLDFMN